MKISIVSDVHLEFGEIRLKNTDSSDVLIIAGDTFVASYISDIERNRDIIRFFKEINEQWDNIILLFGNHEYYHGRLEADYIENLLRSHVDMTNVHIFNPGSIKLGDVLFVGATLWTDFNNANYYAMQTAENSLNDYRLIYRGKRHITANTTLNLHRIEMNYITKVVTENAHEKIVVVTHHAPTFNSISRDHIRNNLDLTYAYASDLSSFIMSNPAIRYWIHGHTHFNVDYEVGSTRVIANQRGYIGHEPIARDFAIKTITL
jgi:predicted phosphodiesterase